MRVPIVAVTDAPDPPPPLKVTVGALRYPAPPPPDSVVYGEVARPLYSGGKVFGVAVNTPTRLFTASTLNVVVSKVASPLTVIPPVIFNMPVTVPPVPVITPGVVFMYASISLKLAFIWLATILVPALKVLVTERVI